VKGKAHNPTDIIIKEAGVEGLYELSGPEIIYRFRKWYKKREKEMTSRERFNLPFEIAGWAIVGWLTLGLIPWGKVGKAVWDGAKWIWSAAIPEIEKFLERVEITPPETETPKALPEEKRKKEVAEVPWQLIAAAVGLLLLATYGE